MLKVYFENKVIIFDNKNSTYSDYFIEYDINKGEKVPQWRELQEIFRDKNGAVIVSDSPYETLKEFEKGFKEVTAAGGVVRNDKNEILMIFRHSRWDLPKGKIEKGEKIEACALREVNEECSIEPLKLGNKICETYHIYPLHGEWILKTSHWFNMTFSGDMTPKPQIEEDITEAVWFTEDAVREKLNNSYFTICDIFKELGITKK